jgi:hypothetical protein
MKDLGSESKVCQKFKEKVFYFIKETCAIMASTRGFGFKNINFGGFFPGKRSPKPFFDCGGQGCRIISDY